MSHYKSNLRDTRFNLFESLRIQEYLGSAAFPGMDIDVADDVLVEVERLARGEFAASFADADRNPPQLEDGVVTLPESLKKSLQAYFDGGWQNLGIPQEFGGFGSPDALRWAAQEFLVGANPAAYFYASGTLMAVVLGKTGTPEQVDRFVQPMLERNWGGTMVLTEPDAGSDVGSGTSKATHIEGDTYHLEGVKRFITSGEHDFAENIIHLVLARREGGEPGTKGLSMFIVPKFLVNDDGSLGERNGIVATNLEKKMGIKASTTCELTMGTDGPCVGYLVGGVHQGIRQMFHIIEDARLLIGTKSAATLSTGYLNALEYAKERVQSADLTEMADKTAPRVPIINHPNVRRMLMTLKAYSEGLRALFIYTAWTNDQAKLVEGEAATAWEKRSDLLLPLLKGYASEVAFDELGQALQVFGGSGFTQDYPIEQYIRDVKIDSLYEGTTGIQSLDLFFRKIARDRGETLTALAGSILETIKGGGLEDAFAAERTALGESLELVQAQLGTMVGHLMNAQENPPEIYKVGLHTVGLLSSLAEVVIAWLLLQHAEIAHAAMDSASPADLSFYEGKIASARWFVRTVLPEIAVRSALAAHEDGSLMDMPLEAF